MTEDDLQITEMNQEEIDKLISQLDDTDLEDASKFALKELIRSNNNDIFFKTELHMPQIESITKLRFLASIIKFQSDHYNTQDKEKAYKELNAVEDMTNLLMKLLVSKQRAGRGEFVRAWEGSQDRQQGQTMFRKFFGGTGGNM